MNPIMFENFNFIRVRQLSIAAVERLEHSGDKLDFNLRRRVKTMNVERLQTMRKVRTTIIFVSKMRAQLTSRSVNTRDRTPLRSRMRS